MGSVDIKVDPTVKGEIMDMMNSLMGHTTSMLDDVGSILVDEMQTVNPIGETQQLNDLTMSEPKGDMERYIFSAAGHFEPIVDGHLILGPLLTEQQRKWWFWYLKNELGGSYTPKYGTGNKTPPNDYPSEALAAGDDNIDARLDEYLESIIGG